MQLKFFKKQGPIVIGIFGGIIGTLCMEISNLLIFKAGKTETLYGHIAGSLLVSPRRTNQRKNFILGELAHFIIGSFMGIILSLFLKKTSKSNYMIKGLIVSMLTYGSIIAAQKMGWIKKFFFTKTHYSMVWNHILFGLTASQAIVSMADPAIFDCDTPES